VISSNLLTEDQSEDFKPFMRQLPALVLGLRQAGLLKVDGGKRKPVEKTENEAVDIVMHVGDVALANSSPGVTSNGPPSGNDNLPSTMNNEEKLQNPIISRDISEYTKDPPEDQPNDTESPDEIARTEETITEVIIHGDDSASR